MRPFRLGSCSITTARKRAPGTRDQRDLREGGPAERDPGPRRLLGRVVWPVPRVAPVLEQMAAEREGDLKVVKLNIDEEQDLAMQYGVMSIPTMILFRDGEPAVAVTEAQPKGALERALGLEPVATASTRGLGRSDRASCSAASARDRHARALRGVVQSFVPRWSCPAASPGTRA